MKTVHIVIIVLASLAALFLFATKIAARELTLEEKKQRALRPPSIKVTNEEKLSQEEIAAANNLIKTKFNR